MKTSLDYLPEFIRLEIQQITEIIKDAVKPEKIILFGSYATDKYVVSDKYFEDHILYEYRSDYDFLVITSDWRGPEHVLKNKIQNLCRGIRTPINPIVHEMAFVNESLSFGQYFFSDIIKEGVLVYDANTSAFATLKELTPQERKQIAIDYHSQWFKSASVFLKAGKSVLQGAITEQDISMLNNVAFQLHQAAERFYAAILLVVTGYKPKIHNLAELRMLAKHLSNPLYQLFHFPPDDKYEERLFDLLIRGYIDARYKKDYVITFEETEALIERIEKMKEIVGQACLEYIDSIKA